MQKIKELLFYIGIFLMQFAIYAKNVSIIKNVYEDLYNISIIVLFISSIITLVSLKTSKKNWLIFALSIAISYYNYLVTNDYVAIILTTSIVTAYNIDFNEIIKKDLFFKIILFFIIYFAYITGNVEKTYFVRLGEIRYALGFNHPNSLGFYALMFYFELVHFIGNTKINNRIKKLVIVLGNIITFYLMNVAHSRTSQLCMIIFNIALIITYFTKKHKINENKKKPIVKYILLFAILTFISFYSTKQYANGNTLFIRINELLSDRLSIQNQFMKTYNIKLFGNVVNYFETLDNSYIRMFLNYGIVIWLMYGCIFVKMLYTANQKNNQTLKISIIIFMIYGLMEWYMVRPVINIFILFFSQTMLKEKSENNEK